MSPRVLTAALLPCPLPLPPAPPLPALQLYDLYAREYLGPPVDVWALGVLLYLLAYGRLPFEGEAKLQVLNGRVPAPPEAEAAGRPPQLGALVRDMLTVSPRQRPTVQQVLSRLREMAPPELWQLGEEGQGAQAGPAAQPLHERVPSQGWADFASDGSGAASLGRNGSGGGSGGSSFTRRQSGGSGSWATFSPKKGEEGVGPAARAATAAAAAAAGVGSFWSSFGEEAPLTEAPPTEAPEQQHAQQQQQHQHQEQQAQAAPQRQPPPPPHQLPVAARQQAAPAAAAAPLMEPPEASPLSAGLARMSQPSFAAAGSSAAKLPAHPVAASPAAPSTGSECVPWHAAMVSARLTVAASSTQLQHNLTLHCCCPRVCYRERSWSWATAAAGGPGASGGSRGGGR